MVGFHARKLIQKNAIVRVCTILPRFPPRLYARVVSELENGGPLEVKPVMRCRLVPHGVGATLRPGLPGARPGDFMSGPAVCVWEGSELSVVPGPAAGVVRRTFCALASKGSVHFSLRRPCPSNLPGNRTVRAERLSLQSGPRPEIIYCDILLVLNMTPCASCQPGVTLRTCSPNLNFSVDGSAP